MASIKDYNTGENLDYTTDDYKQEEFAPETIPENEITTPPPDGGDKSNQGTGQTTTVKPRGTVMGVPGDEPRFTQTSRYNLLTNESMWDKGFTGDTYEELQKHRADSQPEAIKALYTLGGGVLAGLGTVVEDVGYLLDYATYASIFSDVDFSTSESMNMYREYVSGLSELGRNFKKATESDILPVYETKAIEGDYVDMLFKWGNLKSVLDSAVGFTATGMGAGTAVKAGTKALIKGISKTGKLALQSAKYTGKLGELGAKAAKLEAYTAMFAQKYPKVVETMGAVATSVFTKAAEARMEGLEAYETYLYKLQPFIASGELSKQDAEIAASNAASDVFDATMKTMIGDALMLKGLTRGRKVVSNKLSKPTNWNRFKGTLFGAPKEGLEEMWQEAAKMEGEYQVFKNLKDSFKSDKGIQQMKELGLDPDQYPERWQERLGLFATSTQALVAGTIGLVSGPLQAYGVSRPGNRQRVQQEWANYNRQQSRLQDNEKLFGAEHRFKETMKQVVASNEMRESAQLLNDDVLADITEEVALTGVAIDNFMKGTTADLELLLKEEGSPESTNLISKLSQFKKEFKSAKRYLNPNEMFMLNRDKEVSRKLITHFNSKAQDTNLTNTVRKSYERAAEKEFNKLSATEAEIDFKSSKAYQQELLQGEAYGQSLITASDAIDRSISITEIELLAARFPELSDKADIRINGLRGVGSTGKTTTTIAKSVNNTTTKTSPATGTKEGLKTVIANKIANNQKLTSQEQTEYNKSKRRMNEKAADELTEELPNGRYKDNEGNVYNRNGIPVQSKENFQENYGISNLQNIFNNISSNIGTDPVQVTQDTVDSLTDFYLANIDNVQSPEQLSMAMEAKLTELYQVAMSPVDVTQDIASNKTPEPKPPKSTAKQSKTIVEEAGKNLLDVLSEEEGEDMVDPGADDNKTMQDKFNKLKREQQALNDFIDALLSNNIQVLGDFKRLVQELEAATEDPTRVQTYYNRLRAVYSTLTGDIITDSYNDLMGITEPDPTIDKDTISPEKINTIKEVVLRYISPTQNSISLQDIYLDEEVENINNRNLTPATSVAHLSQQYVWEVKGQNQVGRVTSNSTVEGNPILNPAKYNAGTPITLEANQDYDGKVRLETGKLVSWQVMWNEYKLGDWDLFLKEHQLSQDLTIWDHFPITISGTENKELIGFVHDTAWVNRLNANDEVISDNRKALKEFRAAILPQLIKGIPFETTITEKVIEINKDGIYSGFALNTSKDLANTAISLPDDLVIGTKVISDIEAPNRKSVVNNAMNLDFIDSYFSGTSFIFVPLGMKEGKMKYHAAPLVNSKLNNSQAKSLRQAVEIFVTGNIDTNRGLYEAYNKQGIDLLERDGLKQVLKKVVRLYNSKDKATLEELILARNGKAGMGFIELKGEEVHFGKSVYKVFKKGKTIDPVEFDKFENLILKNMYFNISKDYLNKEEDYNFIEVDTETNELLPYQGDYNTYVKQNSSTYMRSTKLDDGSYSSTIQNVTRFDMKTSEIVEEKEVEAQPSDITKDERVVRLAEKFEQSVEEFIKPVKEGKISLDKYLQAKEVAYKALKHSKHKRC